MQATLARQSQDLRRSPFEQDFRETLEGVREKSISIRGKLAQLRRMDRPRREVYGSDR